MHGFHIPHVTQCVFLQECVKDTLSPISISLNFSQVNSESSQAVLNGDSRRQLLLEVRKLALLLLQNADPQSSTRTTEEDSVLVILLRTPRGT